MADRPLTPRQKKFIELYEGNGTEAARKAGYQGSDDALGKTAYDLLRNPKVMPHIQKRQEKQMKRIIASRAERQEFWTKVMMGEIGGIFMEMKDRLKASELLGRSEADFIEKHVVSHKLTLEDLLNESIKGE